MKKILNKAADFVPEMLDGLIKAHPDQLAYEEDLHCIVRADAPVQGKVALATGGGSGHLPVFLGYVGKGMLDGCAVGDVFASPSADQMAAVTKRIHGGAGVVYIYGNYGGDVLNFDMAAEMAAFEDIEVRTVLVKDDVASAPPEEAGRRRGVAGMVFAFKCAGARADKGGSLDEVVAAAEKALANTRTMGVALSPCTVPMAGKPTFTIGEDEMEIGMGIHGEPGMVREKLQTADQITERMMAAILADLQPAAGDRAGGHGQRAGRDAAGRTLHHLPQGARHPDGPGHQHPPGLRRRIRHLDGDGRRVHHADAAGRRAGRAAGSSGAHALLHAGLSGGGPT